MSRIEKRKRESLYLENNFTYTIFEWDHHRNRQKIKRVEDQKYQISINEIIK